MLYLFIIYYYIYLLFIISHIHLYRDTTKAGLDMFVNYPKAIFKKYLTSYYSIVNVGNQRKMTSLQDTLGKNCFKISDNSES